MTRDELKTAFQRIDIPLSERQLDHLIFTLDADNDNELSYKEVARGIDNYNRDRRFVLFFTFSIFTFCLNSLA